MKKLMKKSLSNLKFESRQEMSHYDNLQFNFCNLLNVSYCPFTEDSQQVIEIIEVYFVIIIMVLLFLFMNNEY